jgi:hypothetical protein
METFKRRAFLSLFPRAIAGAACLPLLEYAQPLITGHPDDHIGCWLDVCAPFIIEYPKAGMHSQIVLTSDSFSSQRGFFGDVDEVTEYEIYLYDAAGNSVAANEVTHRLTVPAMKTTVIPVSDLLRSPNRNFWGGMRIRLRPQGPAVKHASDLFSSAFVRWETNASFTNVHANPDPLQWQVSESFFYSMPFPPLNKYGCVFSLFNPNSATSKGSITLHNAYGGTLRNLPYELPAHSSLLLDLRTGETLKDVDTVLRRLSVGARNVTPSEGSEGGTVVVTNEQKSVKSFGYLFMFQTNRALFSVEHPIHQPPFNPLPATPAFDATGRFAAKNILYTPLVFHSKRIGGVTLDSRFHLSSGAPMEEHLWLKPFIVNAEGEVVWQVIQAESLQSTISPKQIERDAIKLGVHQSCIFDCAKVGLAGNFSGGLGLAITPNSNHTLMKVEVTVKEWGASAFTHFRPGLKSARSYQSHKHRGTIATDYIASGARLEFKGGEIVRDEIIGIINIDEKKSTEIPSLEIFDSNGFATRIKLDAAPPFSCRHYLLSELLSGKIPTTDLTLRLVDETATLLMSILHLDYVRRDIAADHGSDRFSTFGEYNCQTKI